MRPGVLWEHVSPHPEHRWSGCIRDALHAGLRRELERVRELLTGLRFRRAEVGAKMPREVSEVGEEEGS
jgi:hypothetical protein